MVSNVKDKVHSSNKYKTGQKLQGKTVPDCEKGKGWYYERWIPQSKAAQPSRLILPAQHNSM